MTRISHIAFTIVFTLATGCLSAQNPTVRARISGLEVNSEYMSLLEQEAQLQHRNDSINEMVASARTSFRTDSLNRAENAVKILEMEEKMFDLRDKLGAVSNKINLIEQDWILQHLNDTPLTAETPSEPTRSTSADAVFKRDLKEEDYAALHKAMNQETQASKLAASFLRNYNRLLELKNSHSSATTAEQATAIFAEFTRIQEENIDIENSLAETWPEVFDNKSYAYNYLLDKEGHTSLMNAFNNELSDAAATVAESDAQSGVVLNYALQKRALLHYEKAIADSLALQNMADSLSRVISTFNADDYTRMSQIGTIRERVFINYQNISVHSPSIYNSRNPIPECTIYPEGTIYRILLGTFSAAQSPTVFHGAAPLCVQKIYNKYRYFAGAFASDSTARVAVNQLKALGFRRPETVVWVDGQYFNPNEEQTADADKRYNITVSSDKPIEESVVQLLSTIAGELDLAKTGESYTIIVTGNYLDARNLADKILKISDDLTVKIEEIAKE